MSGIAKRLEASIRFDAINGDAHERNVCKRQMAEAVAEINRLECVTRKAVNLLAGRKVRFHPIIGGKHDGNVYVVRAANSNALWLYGKAGMVAWDAVSPYSEGDKPWLK